MAQQMEGKVALVTGGNSGMGQAAAIVFARNGAKVVAAARRIPEGEQTVKMIADQGGEAIFIRADVAVESDVEAMVNQTVKTYGRLDYAFNNAALGSVGGRLEDMEEKDFLRTMQVNLVGVWLCLKHELRQMQRQGYGAIVNNSSIGGLVSSPIADAAYVSAKHGVIGLTRQAARENAKKGIRVNAVCPASILTPMMDNLLRSTPGAMDKLVENTPLGRMADPKEVGEVVVWLCSDAASFITGHALPVEGGKLA